jgi:subtilisin family serine protease
MNFSKYTLIISILLFSVINLFSADKSLIIKSLENNQSENYSKTKIYIKTKSDKYAVKYKLLENGINNVKSITKAFDKFTKNKIKFQSDNELENIYLVEFNENKSVIELCIELNNRHDIEYASPVFYRELHEYIPNDYDEEKQYYLEHINAFAAYDVTKGDTSVIVGVVDSGFDLNHEDLKDNFFINYAEIPGDGIDNDENGYVDDFQGWDFVGDRTGPELEAEDFVEDNNVIPRASAVTHGTHVSGLISAVTDNETGIASIGYKVKLLPVKCATDDLQVSRGVYKTNESLLYAYEMGADIINCSWGSNDSYDPVEHDIIKLLYEKNTLLVVSAGNSGRDLAGFQYPADYPEVLTVGSNDDDYERSYFTNFGANVDVFAPGGDIYSTDDNSSYSEKSGTSMSAPIVSGIAALLKSHEPELTAEEIQYRIKSSSFKSDVNDDKLVDAYAALTIDYLPGMKLTEFYVNDGDSVITEYENEVTVKYENILAPIDKMNYTMKSEDFDFSQDYFTMNNNNTFEIKEDFSISQYFPYFKGNANIKVDLETTINDFNYFEQESRVFPYEFKTNNRFINVADINAFYRFWANAQIMDDMTFWGAVYVNNYLYFVRYEDSLNVDDVGNAFERQFQAIDNNTAFFTYKFVGQPDSLSFYKLNFTDENQFEYDELFRLPYTRNHRFHMFDEKHGIIACFYNQLEIYEINNGEIIKMTNLPNVPEGMSIVQFHLFYENNRIGIMLSTSNGVSSHYLYSDDMMDTWTYKEIEKLNKISAIGFSDDSTAMAVADYNEFYFSNDLGETWELVSTQNDGSLLYPNLIYSPENSNEFIFVYPDNRIKSTTDFGKSWSFVKNYDKGYDGGLSVGRASAAATFGNKVRVFNLFDDIEYLEYDLKPKNPEYSYNLQSDNYIDLDTVMLNESKSSYIMLENTGNALLTVAEIYFTNDYGGAYTFRDDIINFISAGKSKSMFFDFTPEFVGGYATEIVIKFKEDVEDLIINIDAYADDPASVSQILNKISIYPIPADDIIFVKNNSEYIFKSIKITDINGKVVFNNNFSEYLNIANLPAGTYFISLITDTMEINKKIIKK